jgi:hypothetical protein
MKRRTGRPRDFSLVRFNPRGLSSREIRLYSFKPNATYVFLGEIPNMPQHCVVADAKTGRIWTGYHTEHFHEIRKNET